MFNNSKEMILSLCDGNKDKMATLWSLLAFEKAAIRHAIVELRKDK